MDESHKNEPQPDRKPHPVGREISNPRLFADDIVFSSTEKILFEEDLQHPGLSDRSSLMDGNPQERYTARRKLNQGGMKAIWEVDDHRTARKVAMALIQDSRIASEDDIDSFLYEARLTANLQHPNIIPIYDIALDESGNPYFTMKALKGKTLAEIIGKLREGDADSGRQYTRTRLLAIFLKVCNAIDYAHSKGVIHLDLKPSNVIVGDFGDVHVLDWGLSTLVTHLGEPAEAPVAWHSMDDVSLEDGQTLTRYLEGSAKRRDRKNVVGGTPGYMSPEQAQGTPADIDFRTDVYMLGALLYEILCHHCPVEGATVKESLQKTVRGGFPDPGRRSPGLRIPPALSAIAMKALATAPDERYPNVAALIQDMLQYQDGYATIAENPTFFTHAALLVKRHKMAVGLITASSMLIAAILANSFASIRRSERIALNALAELQVKNDYIAATARKVAPDYLNLMAREEKDYAFDAAEQALDTALAFDPALETGWMWKGKMLLCQQRFPEAWSILAGNHGHPVQHDAAALTLAKKYKDSGSVPDSAIPQLVADFKSHNVAGGIPRLFHHLNTAPFDPASRFPAIAEALRLLNPRIGELKIQWAASGAGWQIDLANNPDLEDLTPLCGLRIAALDVGDSGTVDLNPVAGSALRELRLAGTPLTHLFDIDEFAGLEILDLGGTRIRNLGNIVKYPRLTTLDISRIEDLAIPPQLLWCRNLKRLTISEIHRDNPTVKNLARRGVIIIYTGN